MNKIMKILMLFILAIFFTINIEAKEQVSKEEIKPIVNLLNQEYAKYKGIKLKSSKDKVTISSPFVIPIDKEFYWDDDDVEIELDDIGIQYYKLYFTSPTSGTMYYNYYKFQNNYFFNYAEEIAKFTFNSDFTNIKIKSLDSYNFYFDYDECEYEDDYDLLPLNNCMGNYKKIIKASFTTSDYKNGTITTSEYPANQFYTEYNDFTYKSIEKMSNGKRYKTDRIYAGRKGIWGDITYVTRDKFYTNTNQIKERTKSTLYSDAYIANPFKLKDIKTKVTSKYTKSNKMTSKRTTTYKNGSTKKKKEIYYTYSNKKKTSRKEYVYNKKGQLKSNSNGKAYHYKTSYKKGKATKTYKYTYSKTGKLTNKTKVKTRS